MSDFEQQTVAPEVPEVEFCIEISCKAGDLSGGNIQAAKFFEDFGDAASGDALKVHLCDGGLERAVCEGTRFQERGSKGFGTTADLRESEIEVTDGGLERARLETVGMAGASLGTLVRVGVEAV